MEDRMFRHRMKRPVIHLSAMCIIPLILITGCALARSYPSPSETAQLVPVLAQDSISIDFIEDVSGTVEAVVVRDERAYTGDSDLIVLQSEPFSRTEILATLPLQHRIHDIDVFGDRVALALGENGVSLIDISNPHTPRVIETITIPEQTVTAVVAKDSRLYVATTRQREGRIYDPFGGEIYVLDTSNPSNSAILGRYDVGQPVQDMQVIGEYLFFVVNRRNGEEDNGGWSTTLQSIDVSNPQLPQPLESLDLPHGSVSLTIDADQAYITHGNSGWSVVDISRVHDFQTVGHYVIETNRTPGVRSAPGVRSLEISGDRIYAVGATNSSIGSEGRKGVLRIIDIELPHKPSVIASADIEGFPLDIAVADDVVYIAAAFGGLQIFGIRNNEPIVK